MAIIYIDGHFNDNYGNKTNQYIKKMKRVKGHIDRLAIEIFKTKNEKDRLELCKFILDDHISNYQSEKIKSYQENYQLKQASLHREELELQKAMNSEIKKIEFQFDIGLQNMQETYNKKKSELESKQKAITKSKKQEKEQQQELQKQLEALNSQADTIRQQSETVAHELEGLHKKAEELSKTLVTVEQKKSQLEAKIEQFKKALDEKEEQLKQAESEWKKISKIAEDVHGLLEKAKLKQDRREDDLNKVKEKIKLLEYMLDENKREEKEFNGDFQRLFKKDNPTIPDSSQEEVEKAHIDLTVHSHEPSSSELHSIVAAWQNTNLDKRLKTLAETRERIKILTPVDNDKIQMIEAKMKAMRSRTWRVPWPKPTWEGTEEEKQE